MKALAVVVAVLFALWLVGRFGARSTGSLHRPGTEQAVEVVSTDADEASISAEAATRERR